MKTVSCNRHWVLRRPEFFGSTAFQDTSLTRSGHCFRPQQARGNCSAPCPPPFGLLLYLRRTATPGLLLEVLMSEGEMGSSVVS